MSAKQDHPFHLVDPSPYPFLTSFAFLIAALGGVFAMHGEPFGTYTLGAGLIALLACAWGWWADVIKEGNKDKAHTPAVQNGLRMGMALFILSELMFFFAFFFSYFSSALIPVDILDGFWSVKEGVFPPEDVKTFNPWDLPLINTLILLLSGTTCTWAHHAIVHGNKQEGVKALAITVGLGVMFSILQVVEYGHAAFGFSDNNYSSNFYMATGFHGLHVIIGTIFLAVNLVRLIKDNFDEKNHLGFEFAAWYWHFVDVVWLFLFVFVYIWGR